MDQTTDPRLNGASVPLTLCLTDKQTGEVTKLDFQMSPLDDVGMSEMDAWVRARYIQTARDSLPPEASQTERDETISLAMRIAIGMTFLAGEGASMMGTIDGVARLTWQAIKGNHPETTVIQIRALMFDKANMSEANRLWRDLNLGKPSSSTEASDGSKKAKRRRSKKHRRREKKFIGR